MTPAEKAAASKKPRKCKPFGTGRLYVWVCQVRTERQKLRLSLRDVAEGAKLSIAGLCEIEKGTDPQLTTARRLADFFGVTVEQLWPARRK